MNLLVVGASYRTAEVELLERLSVSGADRPELLDTLLRGEHIDEAVVLTTCNRVEVYAGVSAFHGGVADVSAVLARRAGLDPAALAPYLYVHWGADAVAHTLRVAAGLDSMVAGETQILGQVREAYAAAADADAVGRLLHDLMQQALRVAKRAHTETGIDRAGRSVVTAALDLAADALRTGERPAPPAAAVEGPSAGPASRDTADRTALAGRGALVVGTGSMGSLALSTLARTGAGPLYLASRVPERAERLAGSYRAEPVALADLPALASDVDLIVSATASARPVLTEARVWQTLAGRGPGRGPLVICDLAVPRDVEPAVAHLPAVVLIDLARMATTLTGTATGELAAAEELVDREADRVLAELRNVAVAPTVAALRARAEEVVDAELDRLGQRLPELTETQRAEVAHAVHRLVQRLLHQPTVRVRQLAAGPDGHTYAAILAELFDLQVPHPRRADQLPDLVSAGESGGGAGETGKSEAGPPAGGPTPAGALSVYRAGASPAGRERPE